MDPTSYVIGSGGYHSSLLPGVQIMITSEAVHLIVNLTADFPKHIAINNRTVNIHGKPGHGKPIDQLIEHYNL